MDDRINQWPLDYERELSRAQEARSLGNEGMARVCARRAAGAVVRAYYSTRGKALPGSSVLNHLRAIQNSPDESDEVRKIARHFALRITPDHILPEDVDLIADVVWLKETLFPDEPET